MTDTDRENMDWESEDVLIRILALINNRCGRSWIKSILAPPTEVSVDKTSIEAQAILIMNSELGPDWLDRTLEEIDEEKE